MNYLAIEKTGKWYSLQTPRRNILFKCFYINIDNGRYSMVIYDKEADAYYRITPYYKRISSLKRKVKTLDIPFDEAETHCVIGRIMNGRP